MKPSSIIAIAAALAGFAMGWMLKPADQNGAPETAANEKATPTLFGKSIRDPRFR